MAITAGINAPLSRELGDAASTPGVSAGEARATYETAWNSADAAREAISTAGFTALLIASTVR